MLLSNSEVIAKFVKSLEFSNIPDEVVNKCKLHLIDTLGCAIAATSQEVMQSVEAYISMDDSSGNSGVFGSGNKVSQETAALLNGMLMHTLDFDDTHQLSYMHVSAPILAALLTYTDISDYSGAEFLRAFISGLEISIRLGMATGSHLHLRGFHPTSVHGVIGATVAIASLLDCNEQEIISGIGIAASFASGIMVYLNDGADTKIVHPGWAAQAAIVAARLAKSGITGSRTSIEGTKGHLWVHDSDHEQLVLSDLGTRWETLNIGLKPYPVCHSAHGAINCASKAYYEMGLRISDIQNIHIVVPTDVVSGMVLEPLESKMRPTSLYQGRFSLPWLLGVFFKEGNILLETLSRENLLTDREVLELASKVTYEVHSLGEGHDLGAKTIIETKTGDIHTIEALIPLGLGGNEMPNDLVYEKFLKNYKFSGANDEGTDLLDYLVNAQTKSVLKLNLDYQNHTQ